jgi:hypothetical protein
MSVRIAIGLVSVLINMSMPTLFGGGRIKDRSTLLHQIDMRINEIARWPYMCVFEQLFFHGSV